MRLAPWQPGDTFGARLRRERTRLGYGLQALADAAEAFGVSPSPYDRTHVQHWHDRVHGPRLDALQYLAHVGLDVAYLVTGTPSPIATRCTPLDGLGLDRWPDPWGPIAPRIEWTAAETTAVRALRRAHPGHAPPAWATEQAGAALLVARHLATNPHVTAPPHHRLEAVAAAWCAHFVLPHGDPARIAHAASITCTTTAPETRVAARDRAA